MLYLSTHLSSHPSTHPPIWPPTSILHSPLYLLPSPVHLPTPPSVYPPTHPYPSIHSPVCVFTPHIHVHPPTHSFLHQPTYHSPLTQHSLQAYSCMHCGGGRCRPTIACTVWVGCRLGTRHSSLSLIFPHSVSPHLPAWKIFFWETHDWGSSRGRVVVCFILLLWKDTLSRRNLGKKGFIL